MSVDFAHIPRDDNGAALPARLRHRDQSFSEGLGVVAFENGVTTSPIEGPVLERVVAGMGEDLEAIEPWEGVGGEDVATAPEAPAPDAEATPPEPEPEPQTAASSPSPATAPALSLPEGRDALIAVAEARGIEVDRRWGIKRIRSAITGAAHADQE